MEPEGCITIDARMRPFNRLAHCTPLVFRRFILGVATVGLVHMSASAAEKPATTIDFNREVRPILAENCFYCHGSDANNRKAKMRLDTKEGAAAKPVILPGRPEESEVIKRIFSNDPEEQMPPPNSNRHLNNNQKEVLKRWIKSGAAYDTHWAFKTPVRPSVPKLKQQRWVRNEIDSFVLAKLEAEKLKPSPEAPMPKLLRRVALDLNGLPPSSEQMQRWLRAKDPLTAAVDELLSSPRFGERMASDWMDVARYADTHGFNNDSLRGMWRWRDWVIDAFNRNLPYDRFITEQLAGDLLPNPTPDQITATGFNRNHVINSEGGIIDEEYRVEYVGDRVRTTSLAWLGLTMECSRCHDHKFDPITQKDYYRMFAFFNNVAEFGEAGRIANAAPFIPAPTAQQQSEMRRQLSAIAEAKTTMIKLLAKADRKTMPFESLATNTPGFSIPEANRIIDLDTVTTGANTISNHAGGKPFVVSGTTTTTNGPLKTAALHFDGKTSLKTDGLAKGDGNWAVAFWARRDDTTAGPIFSTMNFNVPESSEQYGRGVEVRFTAAGAVEVRTARRWPSYSSTILTRETVPTNEWHHVLVACDGSEKARGLRVFIDGEESFRDALYDDFATCGISGAASIGVSKDQKFTGALADLRVWAKPDVTKVVDDVRAAMVQFAVESHDEARLEHAWLAKNNPEFAKAESDWRKSRAELIRLENEAPTTMVMKELATPRSTHVLFRGQYDQARDAVEADVPAFLPPLPLNAPRNRLGLAQWFTNPNHPLTARVVVNRFWQNMFGTGIVKTSEDFGFQSEYPSHPELLDWLAREFVDSGWDVKHLLRLMVNSATYRQDSTSSPKLNERDPENRLLAHGPRTRLTAEMLRDQALALSGLLREQIGGPPVYPYQPANLYQGIVVAAAYPGTSYTDGKGDDLYRRSLYTFWKRTVPHPTLATFDAPDREVCVARRLKTNTPLQALASMNDTIQLEASRKFAERIMNEGGTSSKERIRFAFSLATTRKPDYAEQKALLTFLEKRRAFYRAHADEAKRFLSVGASVATNKIEPAELAAYANVASLILNLDETITRN